MKYFLVALSLIMNFAANATHLRAGELTVEQISCPALTYRITITLYVNTGSQVTPGGRNSTISFGDGTFAIVPELETTLIDEVLKVGKAFYTVTHTYSTDGTYVIGYREQNRNLEVINFASTPIAFYVESTIVIQPGQCNSLPRLLVPPVDRACQGISFVHNPGVSDAEHDSVTYELVVPLAAPIGKVPGYVSPDDIKFYSSAGIDYNKANESKTGRPSLAFNKSTGELIWDAPGALGQYGIAIKITEWKYDAVASAWYISGTVTRDMQIIVTDCTNMKPLVMPVPDQCVVAGKELTFNAVATDPFFQDIVMDVFSETLSPAPTFERRLQLQSTKDPGNAAKIIFHWTPSCEQIRKDVYRFVFKVTNRPNSSVPLSSFLTVLVRVTAPELTFDKVTVNPVSKSVKLEWLPYQCTNLSGTQVWRRTTSLAISTSECDLGMPKNTGFELIGTAQKTSSSFVDAHVDIGVQYCYRLLPLIGEKNVEGRLSNDTCLIANPVTAPAITKVSVQKTATSDGQVTVTWTSPLDLDRLQYPQPYRYRVLRRKVGDTALSPISGTLNDPFFVDMQTNSRELMYEYAIELYVPALSPQPLDTSSIASSVRLNFTAGETSLQLQWNWNTPWSNRAATAPFHLIYRSDNGVDGNYVLLDSVNLLESDALYVDSRNLKQDAHYFYKVVTRGSYGNPKIQSPIVNFSQIAGGETIDLRPPCKPIVQITEPDCSAFPCEENGYFNLLGWEDQESCDTDIIGYKILVQNNEGSFNPIGFVSDYGFKHDHLNTMEHTYAVLSVDDAGNVSDTSFVSGKNCTFFNAPNVFTPSLVDLKNDVLTFFSFENSETSCSRFVKHISFSVFNKWGEEVFKKNVDPIRDSVLWAGTNTAGRDMPGGEYFYLAVVDFNTSDPAVQQQTFKGWIHLIR